jgi:2,4-dienoyl-CoA reductase-like NADH-dependent reductase (Old Yellow Enzyme family)
MPTISDPLALPNGVVLKNRIAKSAMSERLADPDAAPNEQHATLYRRWAEGGAAMLLTGNVFVDRTALGESGNVAVEDERDLEALKAWSAGAREKGAEIWMQINHPGRQSPRSLSKVPVAPSAIGLKGTGGVFATPRALEDHEIDAIVERFATTAAIAKRAGFTGVQIHAAHGYLINQFLSPYTNRRDDRWGGDPDRRRRFLLEVVRAVRRAVPAPFTLAVKLNSADFQRGGFSEEESLQVVGALGAEGIDLLEISGGTYEASAMFDEPKAASTVAREAFFLEYAEKARAATKLPLMVTGGFRTAAGMNHALAQGALDLVGMARPFAVEPDLPRKLIAGEADRAHPVKIATGWRKLDAVIQAGWYQSQIDRLSRGEEAKINLSRFSAAIGYLRTNRRPTGPRRIAA